MEGVGARFGRSSSRYGPSSTTVFNGPVRKWKKKWVPESPSPNHASSNRHSHTTTTTTQNGTNNSSNGNNGSHLLLYKWTRQNNNITSSNGDNSSSAAAASPTEEPPRRKIKYIPIAVLAEQKNEAAEKADDEAKPEELTSKNDDLDGKPDINDVPMEEIQGQDDPPLARQDLNESTLDLSLGLKGHDGDPDSDVKTNLE